jgi:2-dehydropantoate 2-reductase
MILVVGPGAVGTILATFLSAAGRSVRLLVREKYLQQYEATQALLIEGSNGRPLLTAPRPDLTTALDVTGVEYLILCVKYADLDDVLAQLPRPLPATVTLVSTLNGVEAMRRIRARFPAQPSACMTIMFNGQLLSPLHAGITTRPEVIIGSTDERLLALFDGTPMKVRTAHGDSAAWGKLLINLGNAIGALTHATFKDLLTVRDLRAVYAAVLDEAVVTLRRARIDFELPIPIPPERYRLLLLRGGSLPWWSARIRSGLQPGSYPSMVADVEAGRRTEVAQLNGEIVAVAGRCSLPAPINAAIVTLVESVEGQRPPRYMKPAELRARLGV